MTHRFTGTTAANIVLPAAPPVTLHLEDRYITETDDAGLPRFTLAPPRCTARVPVPHREAQTGPYFVIAHGTDTMAYTASALSFMLEGLGKAVVFTGSIIPMAEKLRPPPQPAL